MNSFFPEIKKNFGFGMMRLPMIGEDVDYEQTSVMVDAFLNAGFNYFDTAHPYIQGLSEVAVNRCLASRHPRERFLLANKLSGGCFQTAEDIRPLFDSQLQACGVEYFDFYLMHAMSAKRHQMYLDTRAYDIAQELKAEGKIRHVGMSFHDTAEVLDKILTDRPELEFVQLQLNYVDWEDHRVQSRACYEVCVKHGKPVIVMEPVKGGALVNLPDAAVAEFKKLGDATPVSYALRYAASFPEVFMVLSGMGNMDMMNDNLSYMKDFQPLNQKETEAVWKVADILIKQNQIACTGCRYCVDGCPAGIPIPDIFALLNKKLAKEEDFDEKAYAAFSVQADACVGCGQCEDACPQKLQIRIALCRLVGLALCHLLLNGLVVA